MLHYPVITCRPKEKRHIASPYFDRFIHPTPDNCTPYNCTFAPVQFGMQRNEAIPISALHEQPSSVTPSSASISQPWSPKFLSLPPSLRHPPTIPPRPTWRQHRSARG